MTKNNSSLSLKTGQQQLTVEGVSEDGIFEGYASVFGVKDSASDIVVAGAFKSSLSAHAEKGTFPAMLWQHDPGRPVGIYQEVREDDRGLFVKGKLALDTQLGNEAYAFLKMGALSGLSIGYRTVTSEKDDKTGDRALKEVDLWEISLVTFPCNDKARISGVKSIDEIESLQSLRDVERHLRDAGGHSKQAATAMVAQIKRLVRDERDAQTDATEILAQSSRITQLLLS